MTPSPLLRRLRRNDKGAVTIEWVVLCAATIILALGTIALMEGFGLTVVAGMFK